MLIKNSINNIGTEKAFKLLSDANKLIAKGIDVINLGIGQPDFRTPNHIVEAGIKALKEGKHGYTNSLGLPLLREKISNNLFLRHKAKIETERIVVLPGGKPTIFFTLLLLGKKKSEIIYPDPGFPIYESLIKYCRAKPVPYKLKEKNNFNYKATDILSKITKKTNLIIINNPSNPTGSIFEKKEIIKLINGLKEFPNISILSDEIYSEMLYQKKHNSLLSYPELKEKLIYLDGFSKTYSMTGWRIGYSVWPQKLIPYVEKLCINNHSCVSTFSQYAAIAALDGPVEEKNKMMNEFYKRRENIIKKINEFQSLSCQYPSGAFYAFTNIKRTDFTSNQMQDKILNEVGVALLSGRSFGANGEGFLRISFANNQKNINEAFNRIKTIID